MPCRSVAKRPKSQSMTSRNRTEPSARTVATTWKPVILSVPTAGPTTPSPTRATTTSTEARTARCRSPMRSRMGLALRPGGSLGLGLLLLLPGAHPVERLPRVDVGHREATPVAELAGRLLPAGRLDPDPLGQQGHEDLGLVPPEAGQGEQAAQQVVAVGRLGPDGVGPTVVVLDDRRAHGLGALGEGLGEAVQGGRALEDDE